MGKRQTETKHPWAECFIFNIVVSRWMELLPGEELWLFYTLQATKYLFS